ncbi:hypothetical protein [Mycolicibacterium sp. 120270]|nr:hypothetical protein [Mycolicibacterium sp. 120270]MDX1886740.1 hypothetical protein [Mycolicibacterium sp. 120270]
MLGALGIDGVLGMDVDGIDGGFIPPPPPRPPSGLIGGIVPAGWVG